MLAQQKVQSNSFNGDSTKEELVFYEDHFGKEGYPIDGEEEYASDFEEEPPLFGDKKLTTYRHYQGEGINFFHGDSTCERTGKTVQWLVQHYQTYVFVPPEDAERMKQTIWKEGHNYSWKPEYGQVPAVKKQTSFKQMENTVGMGWDYHQGRIVDEKPGNPNELLFCDLHNLLERYFNTD